MCRTWTVRELGRTDSRIVFRRADNNAELHAVDLSPRAREILHMTNLHTVFTDFPDEQTALRTIDTR